MSPNAFWNRSWVSLFSTPTKTVSHDPVSCVIISPDTDCTLQSISTLAVLLGLCLKTGCFRAHLQVAGGTAEPSLPWSSTRGPGCAVTLPHRAFQGQCPKALNLRAFPEAYYLAVKEGFFLSDSSEFPSNAHIPLHEIHVKILATQSVVHGPAVSPSPGVLWKCRLPGPSPDLLIQDLHFNHIPGDLCARYSLRSMMVLYKW